MQMQIPTNPMYSIDENSVVRLISNGKVIPEYISRQGRRAVKIRGKSHKPASHSLDRLMLSAYKPLPIETDSEWMSVKFLDYNKHNLCVSNLEWGSSWFIPDEIPGFTVSSNKWVRVQGYPEIELRIFHDGIGIRNFYSHKEIGFHNSHGYHVVAIPRRNLNVPLHKLVALTFLAHPLDTDHLTVNHKNSDKTNNYPFNLEWATYSENNFHAFSEGSRSETIRKIVTFNLESKQERVFSGYNELARYFGVLPGSIHAVMDRRRFEGRPYKGHILKYIDDLRTWKELAESGPRDKRIPPKEIACRNMDTGEVRIYGSLKKIEDEEGTNSHALYRLLSKTEMIPWRRKCFQPVVKDMPLVWPVYPEDILRIYEKVHSSDRPLKITDSKGNVKYYSSVSEWCKEDRSNRLDPAVLSRYLKKTNRWKDWVFDYIDLKQYLPN